MKLNKLWESQKGKTWILVTGAVLISGSIGLSMGTQVDKKIQENSTADVITVAQPAVGGAEVKAEETVPLQKLQSVATDLGDMQILYEGSIPKNVTLSGEEAVKIGLAAIHKVNISMDKLPNFVKLHYMSYNGLMRKGCWRCVFEQDPTTLYVLEINCEDKSVNNYTTYTRNQEGESWKNEKYELFSESNMPAFKKIHLSLKSNICCEMTQGDQYVLDMERERNGYELQYEIKDETLYITENIYDKKLADKNRMSITSDYLEIKIPKGIVLDEVTSDSDAVGLELTGIELKNVNLKGVNASIDFVDSKISELDMNVTNGSGDIENSEIEKATIKGANSSLEINQTYMGSGSIEIINGSMNMGVGNKGEISAQVINGTISLEEKKEDSACKYKISVKNGTVINGEDIEGDFFGGMNPVNRVINFDDSEWNNEEDDWEEFSIPEIWE